MSSPLRSLLLAASQSPRARRFVEHNRASQAVVSRFVAGYSQAEALQATQLLVDHGLHVSLDYLGEDTTSAADASTVVAAYEGLLHVLGDSGLSHHVEVSLKLSAVGQALSEELALKHADQLCETAEAAGTTITLDAEDHHTTESTLRIQRQLRDRHPWIGAVVQTQLRRAEQDCRDLGNAGSRVRLCKGAYLEPSTVAFRSQREVDRSYVRCLRILMASHAYPMVATHDPRLIEIARDLARTHDRTATDFEFQMLYGIRETEQQRLRELGYQVRVYVPFGREWYSYFMRRLAERPRNLGFFLRALASSG